MKTTIGGLRARSRVLALLLGCLVLIPSAEVLLAQCFPAPSGVVAWWRGQGDASDNVGTNNGVLNGVAFAAGEVGQAFSFNGWGQGVQVPASPALDVGLGVGLTIEAWINPSALSNDMPIVEWVLNGALAAHFYLGKSSRDSLFANLLDVNNASHTIESPGGAVALGTFQHVALTYDRASGTALLFRNGVIVQQSALGNFTPRTSSSVFIGYRPPTSPFGPLAFRGQIDEVSIYGRALSPSEIQSIYNARSAGKCRGPLITVQPQSQVGYWGKGVIFGVTADGSPELHYQWYKDAAPLPDGTNATLVVTNLQMTSAGSYTVVVANSTGSITSNPGILTMNPAGVTIALYAGVTIEGAVGLTYGVQSTADLGVTNSWRGVANVTLGVPTQLWFDLQPASGPRRYYRVVPGPITIP